MQTRFIIGTALALTLGAGPALALERGDTLGSDPATIRQTLEAQGFEVRKLKDEDEDGGRKIEVYALKHGQRFEIYVDRGTGFVTRVEQDD